MSLNINNNFCSTQIKRMERLRGKGCNVNVDFMGNASLRGTQEVMTWITQYNNGAFLRDFKMRFGKPGNISENYKSVCCTSCQTSLIGFL